MSIMSPRMANSPASMAFIERRKPFWIRRLLSFWVVRLSFSFRMNPRFCAALIGMVF